MTRPREPLGEGKNETDGRLNGAFGCTIDAETVLLLENPLNASPVIFPVIECFHIAGFVLAIGTIALVDFRLLDWVMPHQTPAQLTQDTSVWTLAGLMLVICSGLMIYSTDPDMYYLNLPFLLKIACLIEAELAVVARRNLVGAITLD